MADIHPMNPDVYKAAMKGNYEAYCAALGKTKPDNGVDSRQVTPCGNTVLHVAALYGQTQFVAKILENEDKTNVASSMLLAGNNKNETALHCAAERGYAEVVSVILRAATKYKEDVEHGVGVSMIGMTDNVKDTALHKAARMGHLEVVKLLVQEDREFEYQANAAGETPIYLAAEKPFKECLKETLKTGKNPTRFDGPLERNALHALILSGISDNSPTSVWTIFVFPFLVAKPLEPTELASLLLEEEISLCERKDKYGWTPLHYAVELRYCKTVEMILKEKRSAAYIRAGKEGQKEGHKKEGDEKWTTIFQLAARDENVKMMKCIPDKIPDCWNTMNSETEGGVEEWTTIFHIAARDDNVKMMKCISDMIPDCWDMLNSKSQNVFHEAAARKRKNFGPRSDVVKYILKSPHFDRLADQKDKDGNSPLHMLAISDCHFFRTKPFLNHEHLLFNHKNQTPLDVALENKERVFSHGVFQQGRKYVWSDSRIGRRGNFVEDPEKNENTPTEEKHIETMRKSSDTNTIVATLILGLAFAAGFTVPGGNDENKGVPILLRNTAFMGFVIADTIAFVCSFLSILFHIWLLSSASSSSKKYRSIVKIYTMEAVCLACAFIAVVATFLSGMYATLTSFSTLAITVLALTFSSFITTFLLSNYESIVNFYLGCDFIYNIQICML